MDVDNRIVEVFCKCFGEKLRGKITPQASMDTIAEWNSLSFVDVVVALEEEYGVEFTMDEMAQMNQVSNIIDILRKKTA
jgi:acyl carrier protein